MRINKIIKYKPRWKCLIQFSLFIILIIIISTGKRLCRLFLLKPKVPHCPTFYLVTAQGYQLFVFVFVFLKQRERFSDEDLRSGHTPDCRCTETGGDHARPLFILLGSCLHLLTPDLWESFVVEEDKEHNYVVNSQSQDIHSINIYSAVSGCQALSQCWGQSSGQTSHSL